MSKSKEFDWLEVARKILLSRAIDEIEESELAPRKKVLYQFSSKGHELVQIILGMLLNDPNDAASAYYRSRPLMLTLGLDPVDAIASNMAKSGGYSDGRDIGVVCNLPGINKPMALPMAGDVGSQYTPAAGYAQSLVYRSTVLKDKKVGKSISVVLGGDGSVATNGFWSALTMATTLNLPMLFFIEDNGYGISVKSDHQTPGGNIANNLYSFKNLRIFDGDGTDPDEALQLIQQSVSYVRNRKGPALIRLSVPRLTGHSFQDNQSYKDEKEIEKEEQRDPLVKLKNLIVPDRLTTDDWDEMVKEINEEVKEIARQAEERPDPNDETLFQTLSSHFDKPQKIGGLIPNGHKFPNPVYTATPEKQRINIVEGIKRTLGYELSINEKLVVFGEDVGEKGGVHAATMDLQSSFGKERVFDTSLSEEGIIGRAVGLAYGGLLPVAEIQFRKYADPATEQLKNTGTIRWRTVNKFAAPMVVRMPGGFAKCGDPWHSESNEVFFARMIGWQVAYPSNAEDAVGLLRSAMRSNDPAIFFEHRNLLDSKYARRPYPGDDFVVPFGKAKRLKKGDDLTIVTWGAMCERCEAAAEESEYSVEVIDLRTVMPWDKESVFESVKRTNRCIVVHEDTSTAGFGAEIAAEISDQLFAYLDAPVSRLTVPDIPMPYNVGLMNRILPDRNKIVNKIDELMRY